MPRTKVSSKNSKRNREAAVIEEKIREFERSLEMYLTEMDIKGNAFIADIEAEIKNLIERTNDSVLDMPFVNILNLSSTKLSDCGSMIGNCSSIETSTRSSQLQPTRVASVNDDGYITEDSGNSASSSALKAYFSMTQRGRTPGPLNTAQARRQRLSRSACSENLSRSQVGSTLKTQQRNAAHTEHSSRNRLRTPMSARPKALSADRSAIKNVGENGNKSPSCAFLRWPKPGEFVLSVDGSPIVAPVMPERFANVNIPIKDGGVLSLRPKRLAELDIDMDKFDDETLNQIDTLKNNLGMIMTMASKNKK